MSWEGKAVLYMEETHKCRVAIIQWEHKVRGLMGSKNCARLHSHMQRLSGKSSWFRMMGVRWVSIWMLIVPLVHAHPDAEHTHGDLAHRHHAVTHTVLSASPECEDSFDIDTGNCSAGFHPSTFSIAPHGHAVAHPEDEYPLVVSVTAPTIGKIFLGPSISTEDVPSSPPLPISKNTTARDLPRAMLFLSTALPLRAPPVGHS